jgi:acetyl-CoA carboxylase biotin carboxyl carrier protein
MNLREIRQLIKIVESSAIGELEVEEEGKKIRISKPNIQYAQMPQIEIPHHASPIAAPAPTITQQTAVQSETPSATESEKKEHHEVRAPMVGTFYRAPSPDADPYVDVGEQVNPGQTLCIIEAMKLMNEIESEFSGKIVEVLAENSQPVEYNQLLFLIEK